MTKKRATCPVVGIGASAGGIEAFRGFFQHMPADTGLAFVMVLHLPANRTSVLPDILGRWTGMPVVEATEGCRVESNHVYVPPPGVLVTLDTGRLRLHPLDAGELREPCPITMLFNSLAAQLGEDAIGVVLSGTGNDGALGLKAIKARGGLTLAQGHDDGQGPQHEGMPASAIATGAVDIVAVVESMPEHILAVQNARKDGERSVIPASETDTIRRDICAVLHNELGHDFSGYKDKTFLRRVQRRMHVLGLQTLPSYLARLQRDRGEAVALFSDLLIGVTAFFRDPETFAVLQRLVIPKLFDGKGHDATIRVWVPGCATGEEAYSLAMLMLEQADALGGAAPKIQVFATDIDEAAIATARAGRYPSVLLQGVSPELRARFFVEGYDGSCTVTKRLREICTFSPHSLIRDPPFSRIDLLSCRNLLIYLDSDLQGVVMPAFHYSLVVGGVLLLGSSETVARHERLFATLDRTHRIFEKRDGPTPPVRLPGRPATSLSISTSGRSPAKTEKTPMAPAATNWASTRVLERFAPAFALVAGDGSSLQYSSRIGRFLELAPGAPSQNILAMVRRGLRAPLRAALKEAVETNQSVEKSDIAVTVPDEGRRRITVVVEPRREQGAETLYLIVFLEAGMRADVRPEIAPAEAHEPGADPQAEAALRDTQEQLQSITEEHDTALEELRSANEELHSVNEELQSTNEELETSKEEIQSINEELQTVNSQLAGKVDELDHKNTDLKNLFESTQVATLFLDPYLVIRSFTPAVASIYNLIPSDQGRPLTDIVSSLSYDGLRDDVRRVLTTLEPLERRVATTDRSKHYLTRILPYRTPESTVDGTIITFVDVTSMVRAEQHQRLLVDELNHRVKNMLTIVISMATQTMRRSETLEEFSKNYLGRVHALSVAYSLLSEESWQTVQLRELLMQELKPFMVDDRGNIRLEGPSVFLEPRAALALALAAHELTTNAVKYGALSVSKGKVAVTWSVTPKPDGNQLKLEWLETDGPTVEAPKKAGFGMTLIERGLRQDLSADVKLEFAPTGLRASVKALLQAETAPAEITS